MSDPIEEALLSYPLAEVPPGFSKRVMRQVQRPNAALKFRLTWLDYALGLFLSSLPAVGFVVVASLPRQFFMRLHYQWFLLRSPAIEPIIIITGITLAIFCIPVFIVGYHFIIRSRPAIL